MSRNDQRPWSDGAAGPILKQRTADTAWMARGLCALMGPAKWDGLTSAEIKAACTRCPVRDACLKYALESGQEWAWWAGVQFENGTPQDEAIKATWQRPERPVDPRCRNNHVRTTVNTFRDGSGVLRCRDCIRENDVRNYQRQKEAA